jgi:hypothetical protein
VVGIQEDAVPVTENCWEELALVTSWRARPAVGEPDICLVTIRKDDRPDLLLFLLAGLLPKAAPSVACLERRREAGRLTGMPVPAATQ